jgi:hypothetical protein
MSYGKPYTLEEAQKLVAYHGAPATKCPLDDDRFFATVAALEHAEKQRDEAQAKVDWLVVNELPAVNLQLATRTRERDNALALAADSPSAAARQVAAAIRERDEWRDFCAQVERANATSLKTLEKAEKERDEARAERDEAVRLRDQLLDREKDYLYDIEKAEKERDEARADAERVTKERDTALALLVDNPNVAVHRLAAAMRERDEALAALDGVAERQREKCAEACDRLAEMVRMGAGESHLGQRTEQAARLVRATPLVTGAGK